MKRTVVVLALLLQAVVSASDGEQQRQTEGRGGDRPGPQAPTPEELLRSYDERRAHLLPLPFVALRIATWNTMLQPWLPYESRVINVIQNLSKANLDVIHLQEVWTEEARDRIVAAVGKKYPYRYWSPAVQRSAGCFLPGFEQSINDFISCAINTGTDTRTLEQPVAPIDPFCQFLGLNIALWNQPCYECIVNTMQNLPSGDPGAFGATTLCGQNNGVKYSHQGNLGRLILSRYPITDVEDVPFTAYSHRRVNTYATIAGVRFAFVHWPSNVLHDIDPALGPLQTGALQPDLAQNVLVHAPRVVVGSFNSGPNYQPDGHNLLAQNGYRPLFSQDTHCAAPLQDFPPCADFGDEAQGKPAAVDNIFLEKNTAACVKTTFANEDQSDHIGLAALCIVKTR